MASTAALTYHVLDEKIQTLYDAAGRKDLVPFAAMGLLAQAQQLEEERDRIRIVMELEEARSTAELAQSLAASKKAFEENEKNEKKAAAARRREQREEAARARAAAERKEKEAARDKARREATKARVKAYRDKKRAAMGEEAYKQMVSAERQRQRLKAKANTKKNGVSVAEADAPDSSGRHFLTHYTDLCGVLQKKVLVDTTRHTQYAATARDEKRHRSTEIGSLAFCVLVLACGALSRERREYKNRGFQFGSGHIVATARWAGSGESTKTDASHLQQDALL